MADKNTNGTRFVIFKNREIRMIDKIDRRSKTGDDRENVDSVWNKHTITAEGDRLWSF